MKPSTPYSPPEVSAGDWVMHHPGASKTTALLARVTHVHGRQIEVTVLDNNRHYFSVAHLDDPELSVRQEWKNNGGWSHTRTTIELNELKRRCGDMERRLSTLEAKRDEAPKVKEKAKKPVEETPWDNVGLDTLRELATSAGIPHKPLGWNRGRFINELKAKGVAPPVTEAVA